LEWSLQIAGASFKYAELLQWLTDRFNEYPDGPVHARALKKLQFLKKYNLFLILNGGKKFNKNNHLPFFII